jgi:hypothetical protein
MPGRATNDPANYIALGKQTAKDTEATTFYFLKHLDGSGFDVDYDVQSERVGGDGQEVSFTYRSMVKADGAARHLRVARGGRPAARRRLRLRTPRRWSPRRRPLVDHTIVPVASLPYFTIDQQWADMQERVSTRRSPRSTSSGRRAGRSRSPRTRSAAAPSTSRPRRSPRPASGRADLLPRRVRHAGGAASGAKVTKGKISIKRNVDDGIQTVGLSREDVVELNQDYTLDSPRSTRARRSTSRRTSTAARPSSRTSRRSRCRCSSRPRLARLAEHAARDAAARGHRREGQQARPGRQDGLSCNGHRRRSRVKGATYPFWARVRNGATARLRAELLRVARVLGPPTRAGALAAQPHPRGCDVGVLGRERVAALAFRVDARASTAPRRKAGRR